MGIIQNRYIRIAIIVLIILLIPLIMTIHDGAVEGVGWNWTPGDFIAMGSLLFGVGVLLDYAARKIIKPVPRILIIGTIILAFLALWVELATDGVSRLLGAFLS
jgi:hypothetical protein